MMSTSKAGPRNGDRLRPDCAADTLRTARRVLVTGLVGASVDAAVAACDLAESLGAAVDFGHPEMARPAGPTIARAGEVTAVREELRDRADLVIFWFCDPSTSDSRFIEQFVSPAPRAPLRRDTLAIGPEPVLPASAGHRHLAVKRESAVEAARLLHLLFLGDRPTLDGGSLDVACTAAQQAIAKASCIAIVTDDSSDRVGLEAWSLVHLVRAIAHAKPAFQAPLGDVGAAAAVCTWRYGAAGAIARADRAGGECLPGESSAARLVERGEVDCVVAIGTLAADVERAIAERAIVERGDSLAVVRIADEAAAIRPLVAEVLAAGGRA
jgi:formylmethanofuran dehydrogenase subunit B